MGSCNGFFRALDRQTGQPRWTYDTRLDGDPVEFHGDPLVTEETVVIGSDLRSEGGAGRLYAFDRSSGVPRWTYPAGQGVTTDLPLLGETLFAVTLSDELLALHVGSGGLLWSFTTGVPNPSFFMNSSPAASGGRVFFGGLDGVLYALDAETGTPVWKQPLGPRISTSVLLAEGSLYAGTSDGRLFRVEPSTGEVVGSMQTEEPPAGRLAVAGGCLLAFLGEKAIGCAELSLARIRWTRVNPKGWSSSRPYAWKSFVLAGDNRGELSALRLTDGEPAWSAELQGTIRGIGIGREALYVGTLKGLVHARPLPALHP